MGFYQNLIDAKNRVSVPAKFREELGPKCVLARGLDSCLILYPMETWKEEQVKLAKLPRSDEEARAFLRYTYASAVECDIDKQGRTVIPQFLKEFAGLEKELVTIGMLDRVEIWSKDVYENNPNGGKLTSEALATIGSRFNI